MRKVGELTKKQDLYTTYRAKKVINLGNGNLSKYMTQTQSYMEAFGTTNEKSASASAGKIEPYPKIKESIKIKRERNRVLALEVQQEKIIKRESERRKAEREAKRIALFEELGRSGSYDTSLREDGLPPSNCNGRTFRGAIKGIGREPKRNTRFDTSGWDVLARK